MYKNNKYPAQKEISLADTLDLTGTKPMLMRFRGKTFTYTRLQGWKGLYTDLVKELYKTTPEILQELAKWQQEFFISDEPACWATNNRKEAENYEDNWWVEVGDNVFIYTKNNTLSKIERMRWLLDDCGEKPTNVQIVLY